MAQEAEAGGKTMAEKLDYLFRVVHPRGRGEYTYREVAAAIVEAGTSISPSYIWQLRTGARDNPTMKHLEALGAFFGVGAAYFFDDVVAEKADAELAVMAAMRDAGIRDIALRAGGLSEASLDVVREMIDRTRVLEGLDSAVRSSRDDAGGSENE